MCVCVLHFSGLWNKMPEIATNRFRRFFLANQSLANMLGRTYYCILIYFCIFWNSKVPDFGSDFHLRIISRRRWRRQNSQIPT